MKLQVEVESKSFEKVIEEGIKSLAPDELKDIIKQVILEAFTKCEDFKDLLIKRNNLGYGNTCEVVLGPLAEAAVKNIDMEKELASFKEKMVNALMDNHGRIVEDMFTRCFIERITSDGGFKNAMENAAYRVLLEERSHGYGQQ